ncbi:MAG: AMP-binding protein [Chloroflexi bacterium]|uniref:AMP-dependent synthetase/ligase n=1 Tax=Candidatus Flexifilum breve TaxID=3140694 RepID=UPI003136902B|nr:AMP-binding protein [Chloroflexota bacterium]
MTGAKIYVAKERIDLPPLPADADTLPKNFVRRAAELGDRVAMRKKRFGIWQEYSWIEVHQHVQAMALGLASLGLTRGEKVALIGENDPEFYWAEIATWAVGGVTTAIFTDANLQELAYVVDNSDAVILFAHDQEQCDKALTIREKIPNVRKVIYWDDKGLWNYTDDWLLSIDALEALGREYAKSHAGAFEQMIAAGTGDDVALFSYTSGTTSLPKGAMIRHRNLIYGNKHATSVAPVYPTDNYVSFSPLAWITEQSLGLTSHVMLGVTVNFPESPTTVQHDIREVAPSSLLFPSRIWENLASTMQMRINDSTWLNRTLFNLFLPIAYKIEEYEDAGKAVPLHLRALKVVGDLAVFQPLRDKIGMTRMRHAYTSGASLSPDQLRFFRAVGVSLKNLYGSTECQAHTLHYDRNIKMETVGLPCPGVEIKLGADNEVWVRSRAVFGGYYKDAEKTATALDAEGFFHTGDAGFFDEDGHLIYLDRVSDMIELANGEKFSPQYIEGRLKFSPYIQDVMTVGGFDMHYVTAIVNINFENVARWAEKNRLAFTTFVDLSQKQEVYDLIKREVERVNKTLPEAARVRKFVILHKAFDADENELTRTRKLRRRTLEQKYGEMLDAMYGNRDRVTVSAEVKYRDGRTGVVETAVRVCTV